MNFLKKNLIFLLSAGLIISNFSSSFSMKRPGYTLEEPEAKRSKVDVNQFSAHLSEIEGYRNRFINAIKNNDQEELAFFEQNVDIEFKNQTFYLPLKNILFLDTYTVLILDAKIDAKIKNSSKITLSLNSSDLEYPAYYYELTKLWEILTNPFNFIFKKPERINNDIDRTLDFHGMNLDFILEYADALIASGNYNNFNINYIENFLRNNKDNIDPAQLSPQLLFILKAINNTVENEINYSAIYNILKKTLIFEYSILTLEWLGIDHALLEIILPLIKLNKHLQSLNISCNQLNTLPESIGVLVNINVLNASYNQLTNLPDNIGNFVNLQKLTLSHNELNSLPNSIGKLVNLQELDISFNQLTSIPNNISNLKNLKNLDLSDNQLINFPENICNLVNLKTLNVSYNQLITFPNNIGNLVNLKNLLACSNELTNLPDNIGNLLKLEELDLALNELANIPNNISNLVNLQWLRMQNNLLTFLPNNIGNLVNLKNLIIFENQLLNLPESIYNLVNLQVLDASSNQLTYLSEGIGNLVNLQILDVSDNQLNNLPGSMYNLTQLKTLNFRDNPLLADTLQIDIFNDNPEIQNWLQEHFPAQ